MTQGAVTFTSAQHTAFAEIKPDGTYAMGTTEADDGVPPGTYQVSVTVGSGYGEEAEPTPALDPKFQNPSTSGLTCEVPDSGPVTYDITVEKAQ